MANTQDHDRKVGLFSERHALSSSPDLFQELSNMKNTMKNMPGKNSTYDQAAYAIDDALEGLKDDTRILENGS